MRGICPVLNAPELKAELHVEYMDNLRHAQDRIFPELEALYRKKFGHLPLKVIIATDDIALDFLLPRRQTLFPGVPLVFCGPNDLDPARIAGQSRITGVVESIDFAGTLRLMLLLFPETRQVAVVSDRGEISTARLATLEKAKVAPGNRLVFLNTTDSSLEALETELAAMPDNTAVLFLNFITDASGYVHASGVDVLERLSRDSRLPFFTYKKVDIGHGAVGGSVISEEQMAGYAARMAADIIRGKNPDDIPVLYQTPTVPMFDYRMLKHFDIDSEKLPDDSIIINRPVSFYGEYWLLVWTVAGIIAILVLLIFGLSINIARRKRAEAHLKKIRDELERRVAERTAELAETNEILKREVLERRQTEKALIENEIKFRSIFHLSPQAVSLSEPESGRVLDVNEHFCRMTGYTRDELINRTVMEIGLYFQNNDRERLLRELELQGRVDGMEVGFKSRNNTRLEMLLSSRLIRIKDNPVILTILVDVTRRNQIEKHLQTTRRMDAIATLAGGIAHQFNNALQGIIGNLDLLAMRFSEDEFMGPRLASMKETSRRMSRLTAQLLAYARGGRYAMKPVNLNDLVRDTISIIRHNLDPGIRILTDLPDERLGIEADSTQIQMVLSGILSNASEAMTGPGTIRVTARPLDIDEDAVERMPDAVAGRFVLIRIEDTGKGMDEETRSRIFEPFFTTNFQGRGLGMAAVYGIIKNHGGWITVDSGPNRGTTVSIYIPRMNMIPDGSDAATVPVPARNNDNGTVLLIEDEKIVMDVARNMLMKMGFRVLEAENGADAVKIARDFPGFIDLALLDIVLPDKGGAEVFHLLRENRPTLKILISSGYSLEGPVREILTQGAQGFIQKPYSYDSFCQKINHVVQRISCPL